MNILNAVHSWDVCSAIEFRKYFLPVCYEKVELNVWKNVISFLNVYGCAVEFIILGENTSWI